MGSVHGIVKRRVEEGYVEVAQVSHDDEMKDIQAWTLEVTAAKVKSAVETKLDHAFLGELYFSDQDPQNNDYGYKIEANNMGQLKAWARAQNKYVYFFNK